jgi:DNA-binding transcriptional MocR family regulator
MAGGYFLWVGLPKGVSAKHLAKIAQSEENLVVAEGGLFEVPGDNKGDESSFDNCIRLCFTFEEEYRLAEGIERLGWVLGRIVRGEEAPVIVESDRAGKDPTSTFW